MVQSRSAAFLREPMEILELVKNLEPAIRAVKRGHQMGEARRQKQETANRARCVVSNESQ